MVKINSRFFASCIVQFAGKVNESRRGIMPFVYLHGGFCNPPGGGQCWRLDPHEIEKEGTGQALFVNGSRKSMGWAVDIRLAFAI